jgi:hypothetical protein
MEIMVYLWGCIILTVFAIIVVNDLGGIRSKFIKRVHSKRFIRRKRPERERPESRNQQQPEQKYKLSKQERLENQFRELITSSLYDDLSLEAPPPKEKSFKQTPRYERSELTDWEYTSDGKRMCFINFKDGRRVYHEDDLFHDLKRNLLK